MFLSDKWRDYELIDASEGEKLERWGEVLLIRPDPQIVWKISDENKSELWQKADARYIRSASGGGHWEYYGKRLSDWEIKYGALRYGVKPMGFKHTGLFPEQAANWDWFSEIIKNSGRSGIKVLNLFAYTGGATIAAAKAGAEVCHVDAAKGMVSWAKENAARSGLANHPIRYIVDDVKKFVGREIRRGKHYDGIIMDPPSYGRGPSGEVWKIEDELFGLVEMCNEILSENPLFFLINSYTTGLACSALQNIMSLTVEKKFGGKTDAGEVGIPITNGNIVLPCGYSARWTK